MIELMSNQLALLRWKVIKTLNDPLPLDSKNKVFNIAPYKGIFTQFGVPLNVCHVPQVFSPTITFHQTLKNLLFRYHGISIQETKFPYRIHVPMLDKEVLVNIQVKLFQPNILSIGVSLSAINAIFEPEQLINLQRLDRIQPLNDIIKWIINMVVTLDNKELLHPQTYKIAPAMWVIDEANSQNFPNSFLTQTRKYIGILIRNSDYEYMDMELPNRIVQKNHSHNLKSYQETLLIDTQGILLISASDIEDVDKIKQRISRTHDLYEIAFVINLFLIEYSSYRLRNEDLADFFLNKIRYWINDPENIFSSSVTHTHIWKLLIEELNLRSHLQAVLKPQVLSALEEKSIYFDMYAVDWWVENQFSYILSALVTS